MAPKLVHVLLRAAYADRPDWPAGVVFLGPFRDIAPRRGEHPSTHEERKVVTGLHPNGDGGRPTPGFNRRGVGQSHDLRRPREQMCDWTFDSPAKRPIAGKQSLVSRFSRKTTPPSVESRRVRGASREGGDDKKIRTGTNAAPPVQAELV